MTVPLLPLLAKMTPGAIAGPSPQPGSGPGSAAPQKTNKLARVAPWLAWLVYPFARYFLLPAYFGPITIHGRDRLPRSGPVIIAPTHRSRWDAVLVPFAVGRYATGRDVRFMVSANEVKGFQGWFIRRLGGFPIDTKRPGSAAVRCSLEVLTAGEMLVIFPEGDIFRDGSLHPLKPGVARFALQAEGHQENGVGLGVKIVPVHLRYGQPFPTWGCPVTIHIGEPIAVEDYSQEPLKVATAALSDRLDAALRALDAIALPEDP